MRSLRSTRNGIEPFSGITTAQYQMLVAVMVKGNSVRTAVIQENTVVPYNKKCELEEWSSPK